MDVWAGDIALSDGERITNIQLSTTRPANLSLPPSALRFLALVDPARIPFYLVAGPCLDVWTSSESTENWFSALLLENQPVAKHDLAMHEWWNESGTQSPVGILAQVDHSKQDVSALQITEILFYATVNASLIRLHALPLSSDHFLRLPTATTPPLSPHLRARESKPNSQDIENAEFLPPLFDLTESFTTELRKRHSVSSLFDEAAERRKKARRKGGESIAAAASKANFPTIPVSHRRSSSFGNTSNASDLPDRTIDEQSRPGSAAGVAVKGARPLSRSPSLTIESRPLSRKEILNGPAKRSSLSRMASVADLDQEPSIESRNKDTISRLVMAGMRMYGLQQRKKDRRKSYVVQADGVHCQEEQSAEDAAKDEEYKLVYHQTYKGAVFAMRNYITTDPLHLHVDQLRETVDKLLAIFCTDPLQSHLDPPSTILTPGHHKQPFGTPNHSFEKSPFDDKREYFGSNNVEKQTIGHVHTPVTRRTLGSSG